MSMQTATEHATAVPDYLDHFDLQDDPFSDVGAPFFDGGNRRELLSQLLHLSQFSASTLVVVGEEGVGKTSLKNELKRQFAEQDQVCDFDVPALSNSDWLLQQLSQQLSVELDSDNPTEAIALLRLSAQQEEDDILKVILVHNAQNLDEESLRLLMRLIAEGDASPYRQYHIILFATPEFEARFSSIDDRSLLQTFHLPALDQQEIKHYLRFRMEEVGFSGIFPFKESDIRFLHDISNGIPAKFHDAARDILIELSTPPPEQKSMGLPATHLAAVVMLVAVLLMLFFYNRGGEPEPEIVQLNLPPQVAEEVEGINNLNSEDDVQNELNSAAQNIDLNNTANTASPNANQLSSETPVAGLQVLDPQLEQQEESPISAIEKNETAEDRELENSAREQTESQPIVPQPLINREDDVEELIAAARKEMEENALQAQTAANIPQLPNDEGELMAMPPSNFALQILASGSREAVDDFLSRQPNRNELSLYVANRQGKRLFLVVMGNFPSSEAARAAVGRLPNDQRKAGPWPRQLETIQAEIRQFRGF